MNVSSGSSLNLKVSVAFSVKEGILNNTYVIFLMMSDRDIKPNSLVNLWFAIGMLSKITHVILKKRILMCRQNWEPLLMVLDKCEELLVSLESFMNT